MEYKQILEEIKYYKAMIFNNDILKSRIMLGKVLTKIRSLKAELYSIYEKNPTEELKNAVIEESVKFVKLLERLLKSKMIDETNTLYRYVPFCTCLQAIYSEFQSLQHLDNEQKLAYQCECSQLSVKEHLKEIKHPERIRKIRFINENLNRIFPEKVEYSHQS